MPEPTPSPAGRSRRWLKASTGIAAALAMRPDLWLTAVRQVAVLAPPGWWQRRPPLPTPDPAYLRFRLQTAYGAGAGPVPPSDLVGYLEWCRRQRAYRR
ncbi:MAG TPA: hypothetical protein VGH66_01920 [Acidimicrobiales bacterium]|jgi:hypothetical protein